MKPLGIIKDRWKDTIKTDHKEMACESVDWVHLAQDRDRWRAVGNTVTNLGFHKILGTSGVVEKLLGGVSVFWIIKTCSLLKINRRLGGTCLHVLDGRIS
jgi:hypothetical protein